MKAKKDVGERALGRPPLSHDKLEGPKVRHDFHGNDASVPAKGSNRAVPEGHWEMMYNPCGYNGPTPAGAFVPKRSKDRPQPYNKINESDH